MSQVYPLEAIADLAHALGDAERHLPRIYGTQTGPTHMIEPFDFTMWTQQFSDTTVGFGGLGGQGFTPATVFVGWRERGSHAVVFISGRYAYPVHFDDPRRKMFWDAVVQHTLPGAADWLRSCKHRLAKNSNVCDFCGRGQKT